MSETPTVAKRSSVPPDSVLYKNILTNAEKDTTGVVKRIVFEKDSACAKTPSLSFCSVFKAAADSLRRR